MTTRRLRQAVLLKETLVSEMREDGGPDGDDPGGHVHDRPRRASQVQGILAKFKTGDTISVTWVTPWSQRETGSLRLTAGPPQ